jgi:hypothetical protein
VVRELAAIKIANRALPVVRKHWHPSRSPLLDAGLMVDEDHRFRQLLPGVRFA